MTETITPLSPLIIIPAVAEFDREAAIAQRAAEIEEKLNAANLNGMGVIVIDIHALALAAATNQLTYYKPTIRRCGPRNAGDADADQRELENFHHNLSDDEIGRMLDAEGQS